MSKAAYIWDHHAGSSLTVFVMRCKPTQLHRPNSNCKGGNRIISTENAIVDPVGRERGKKERAKERKENARPFTNL